jgi:hypothetical protein
MSVTEREFNPSSHPGIDAIKAKALELEEVIRANAPAGRRRSVALTNLETASMWAVKAAIKGDE